ncbi:MAG: LexA family transcriptional regulator [Sphaerochaetaceae bacterium]
MSSERLKKIRQYKGMSQRAFGELLGIPQTTYANYESGKAIMPDELKKTLAKMGINLHWLITGEGPMTLDGEAAPASVSAVSSGSYVSAKGKLVATEMPDGGLSVPIIKQRISAGPGQIWTDADILEGLRLPILNRFVRPGQKGHVFGAEVRGDSMTGVQLFDGDFVFFVHGEVEGDGIYVLAVDDEVFVKRVHFNPFDKTVTIKSENVKYDPVTVSADRVHLLGKVVGWFHNHPY